MSGPDGISPANLALNALLRRLPDGQPATIKVTANLARTLIRIRFGRLEPASSFVGGSEWSFNDAALQSEMEQVEKLFQD